jgi:hypothetical protein
MIAEKKLKFFYPTPISRANAGMKNKKGGESLYGNGK